MKTLQLCFAVCFIAISTANAQIPAAEKQALTDLYHSTNGDKWKTTWDLEAPESSWHGVEIKNNSVVSIDLGFNNLVGTIPASIGNLKNLRSLKLFFNQLEGRIPSEIGGLAHLQVLDLNSNNLSGKIPQSLGELRNLKELLLSSNQLTGSLPASIGNLRELSTLVVFDNNLHGEIPASVYRLNNLSELVIAQNNFSEDPAIPSEILLTTGTELDFSNKLVNTTELATVVTEEND